MGMKKNCSLNLGTDSIINSDAPFFIENDVLSDDEPFFNENDVLSDDEIESYFDLLCYQFINSELQL